MESLADPVVGYLLAHVVGEGPAKFMEHLWVLLVVPIELMRQQLRAHRERLKQYEQLFRSHPPLTPAELQRVIDREFERVFDSVIQKSELLHHGSVTRILDGVRKEISDLPCKASSSYTVRRNDSPDAGLDDDEQIDRRRSGDPKVSFERRATSTE